MGHKTVGDIQSLMEMMPNDRGFQEALVEHLTGLTPEQIALARRVFDHLATTMAHILEPELDAMRKGYTLSPNTEFELSTLGTRIVKTYLQTGQKREHPTESSG